MNLYIGISILSIFKVIAYAKTINLATESTEFSEIVKSTSPLDMCDSVAFSSVFSAISVAKKIRR